MLAKYLDVSTAHLPEGELNGARSNHPDLPRCIPHTYGVWVNVSHDDVEDADAEMVRHYPHVLGVIQYARTLGSDVNWVNFDGDGDVIESLPTPGMSEAEDDTASSVSRQHYIDTGRYLTTAEVAELKN